MPEKKIKTKQKEIDIKELADWSGEATVRKFKFSVPILKFNGNTGKFNLLVPDESGNWVPEQLPENIEITVLKVRRVLSSYEKLSDGTGLRFFTNEHNSWKDPLTVFEMGKGDSKPRMVDAGGIQQIRKNFPNLRLRQNVYCLLGEQIVKMSVRGKSLSALFNYYQTFNSSEHIFQYVTNLTSHSETNEGGLTYYVLDWEKGSNTDLNLVAEKIKEVKDSLDLQDHQYAESAISEEIKPEFEDIETKFQSSQGNENEEEIQVKDIPL